MNTGVKLSIITPVKNDLANLSYTLKNLKKIPEGIVEHIFIDGNSSDGSFEFIKKFKKLKNYKVLSQQSETIYGAFNEALQESQGIFIIFLHCGDILHLDEVLELISENSQSDVLACSCSQTLNPGNKSIYLRSERQKLSKNSTSILQSSLIIKLKKYKEVNFYDETLSVSSDVDCIIRIIKTGAKIKYFDDVICDMKGYGISNKKYFSKIFDHSIIKFRHVGFFHGITYVPKRILKDIFIIPLWKIYKNLTSL